MERYVISHASVFFCHRGYKKGQQKSQADISQQEQIELSYFFLILAKYCSGQLTWLFSSSWDKTAFTTAIILLRACPALVDI